MAGPTNPLPHDFPDRAMREALVYPDNLRALLRRVAPAVADHLDYSRLEVVQRLYLLDDWRRRDNDVLVRLPFLDGTREVLVCVLIEHQSTTDPVMPLRVLVYAVLFWEQQWKQWEEGHERGVPLRLTPVLPVVFHTGAQPWDTSRSLADLFDVPTELQAWLPQWAMLLWDLPLHPAGVGAKFGGVLAGAGGGASGAGADRRVSGDVATGVGTIADARHRGTCALGSVDAVGAGLVDVPSPPAGTRSCSCLGASQSRRCRPAKEDRTDEPASRKDLG